MTSILFIGAGRMGAPMARHLVRAGLPVSVVDKSPEVRDSFSALGAPVGETAADLAGETIVTMLPAAADVRQALLGPGGACTGQIRRHYVIDMSSSEPGQTRALSDELAQLGIYVLDAPVSGGVEGAVAGTLTAMVGGEADAVERCRPVLQLMCGDIYHVGPIGSGHVVKALNNFLSAATLWTATEALLIGQRLGLNPHAMLAAWNSGSGRSHATAVKLPRHVLSGRYDFGQSLLLFNKDLAIAQDLAQHAELEAPGLAAIVKFWQTARDRIGPQGDITEIANMLAQATYQKS